MAHVLIAYGTRQGHTKIITDRIAVALRAAGHDTQSEADINAVVESFVRDNGWAPARIEKFAGALEYSKYNWLVKRITRRIVHKKEGGRFQDTSRDYDLTDYGHVDAFARQTTTAFSPARR